MGNKTITDLVTELLATDVDSDDDWLEIDDTSAGITKKVHPRSVVQGGDGLLKDGTIAAAKFVVTSTVVQDALAITHTVVGAGDAIDIVMGASTTGAGVRMTTPVGGDGLTITDGADTLTARANAVRASGALSFLTATVARLVLGAGGGVTVQNGALQIPDADGANPGLRIASAADTGIKGIDADTIALIASGVEITRATAPSGANPQFLIGQDGTQSRPSLAWVGDLDTGLAHTADVVTVYCGNTFVAQFNNTTNVSMGGGSFAIPGINSIFDLDTGLYLPGSGVVGLSSDGAAVLTLKRALTAATGDEVANEITTVVNKATSGSYTALKLSVTETNAPGAADKLIDAQVGGASKFSVDNTGIAAPQRLATPPGSAANPAVTQTDLSSGMYFPANKQVGFSTDGILRLLFGTGAIISHLPIYPDATANLRALGDATALWSNVHATVLTAYTSVLPDADLGAVLGGDTTRFTRGYFGDGTAAVPSMWMNGDKGIYGGTNEVGVATAGVGRVKVTNTTIEPITDDNIGLGTPSKRFKDIYCVNAIIGTALKADADGGADVGETATKFANAYIEKVWGEEVASEQWKIKAASESVTSSATLQDDDHLVVSLTNGGTYTFSGVLFVLEAGATAGIKVALNGTAGFSVFRARIRIVKSDGTVAAIANVSAFDSVVEFAGLAATDHWVEIDGKIVCSSSGTLLVRWAQSTSDANATTLRDTSFLRAFRHT